MQVINVTSQLEPKESLIPLKLYKVKFLVIHHVEADNCTWKDINTWHKQNGWNCAGYNEFIAKNGDVYILRADNIGAQCLGYNSCSYGIALEGNYDKTIDVPQAQYISLVERTKYNMSRFPPNCVVVPHRELVDTECPGKLFPMTKLLSDISPNNDTAFYNVLKILTDNGVISSPDYWKKSDKIDAIFKGEYVKKLLENMANTIFMLKGGV